MGKHIVQRRMLYWHAENVVVETSDEDENPQDEAEDKARDYDIVESLGGGFEDGQAYNGDDDEFIYQEPYSEDAAEKLREEAAADPCAKLLLALKGIRAAHTHCNQVEDYMDEKGIDQDCPEWLEALAQLMKAETAADEAIKAAEPAQ